MRPYLSAEWTKLRTDPVTGWLLAAVVALTVTLGVATAAAVSGPADPVKTSLTGVVLGQGVVVVLAVLTVGGEYGTGMMRTTLMAMPRRMWVLTAKAILVTALVAGAGTVAVVVSLIGGDAGADAATLRAGFGSVLYLVLVALLALGIAAAVRDSAAAVGAVLGLLYLFPLVATAVGDPDWQRRLRQAGPMDAGLAVQATTGLDRLPIGPWPGLGVLAAWAAAS
ncbi:MAG TPA: ABC transporter permease, partial [Thermomonospora sp.]|nr:ABC transporter permease [Thermomonospora sp.]